MDDLTARQIIELLEMQRHPEGGWYVETWRAPTEGEPGGRPASTAISFLLEQDQRSHWHRVDADEIFCHHAGAPYRLFVSPDDAAIEEHVLGGDLAAGQRPHAVVPKGRWQAAVSDGAWSLVSCIVAPGFRFEGFELAPPGWSPGST